MISFYTGTPGSGKSYHLTNRIYNALRRHDINIICNFPINLENCSLTLLGWLKRRITDDFGVQFQNYNSRPLKGRFYYWDNSQVTVENLLLFASLNHTPRKGQNVDKPQTLVFLDEAGIVFNCRGFMDKERNKWTEFFAKHRHYCYEFVLACQFDRQVDRQIRYCVEYEWKHRKLSNFKLFGSVLKALAHGELFLTYQSWYATKDNAGLGRELIRFSPRIASLYDTLGEFTASLGSDADDILPAGCTADGGGQGAPPPPCTECEDDTAPEPCAVRIWPLSGLQSLLGRLRRWVPSVRLKRDTGDSGLNDTVQLSDLFGRDIDATKPLSEQGVAVPGAGAGVDAADLGDADLSSRGSGRAR